MESVIEYFARLWLTRWLFIFRCKTCGKMLSHITKSDFSPEVYAELQRTGDIVFTLSMYRCRNTACKEYWKKSGVMIL